MVLNYLSEYKKKTKRSAKLFTKSKKLHINGVSHNIRFFEPYPFVVKKSSGKNLIDVDDNKYTDYWMGHWSLILGHGPKNVKEGLRERRVRFGNGFQVLHWKHLLQVRQGGDGHWGKYFYGILSTKFATKFLLDFSRH